MVRTRKSGAEQLSSLAFGQLPDHQEQNRMAVRLRLKRMGRKNLPFFRLCAFDSRTRRDGRAIEELGHYDPRLDSEEKQYNFNRERIAYWLSVGAKPTETV